MFLLASAGVVLSTMSALYIIYRAFNNFSPVMHITCFIGTLIIEALCILDLLRAVDLLEFDDKYISIYFLFTSLTAILSCYVLLHVGTNFYQEYNFIKTFLIFAPIAVTFGVFGVSVYTVITFSINYNSNKTYDVDIDMSLEKLTLFLSLLAAGLTLAYVVCPLFTIRRQTELRPEQTAISIINLLTVLIFFVAHFAVYCTIILSGPLSDIDIESIHNIILLLIFPGCLIKPPRKLVKIVKRKMLGVEELLIGGDFRPAMMLNGFDQAKGPIIEHVLPAHISNSRRSLMNSASPKRSDTP
ncbi:34083_t:CDS:1 [Racocetra persica]|uniref:34083_t:CDS:1 n=1 Tax=Racocetra persica TaxID=160502 RepID=A0ACA9PL37_9GLOM|nr:34083_t:CDS:1 [Racocetra persica]